MAILILHKILSNKIIFRERRFFSVLSRAWAKKKIWFPMKNRAGLDIRILRFRYSTTKLQGLGSELCHYDVHMLHASCTLV